MLSLASLALLLERPAQSWAISAINGQDNSRCWIFAWRKKYQAHLRQVTGHAKKSGLMHEALHAVKQQREILSPIIRISSIACSQLQMTRVGLGGPKLPYPMTARASFSSDRPSLRHHVYLRERDCCGWFSAGEQPLRVQICSRQGQQTSTSETFGAISSLRIAWLKRAMG